VSIFIEKFDTTLIKVYDFLSWNQRLKILTDVLKSLDYIHYYGFSGNVLININPLRAVVCDFYVSSGFTDDDTGAWNFSNDILQFIQMIGHFHDIDVDIVYSLIEKDSSVAKPER